MAQKQGNQEPLVLKGGHKIYPWDVVSIDKVDGAWEVWIRNTEAPLVITRRGDRPAYDQLERLMHTPKE